MTRDTLISKMLGNTTDVAQAITYVDHLQRHHAALWLISLAQFAIIMALLWGGR